MHLALDARTATDHFPGIGRYVVNLARGLAQVAPDLRISLLQDPNAPATRLPLPDLPRIPCLASPFSIRQQWLVPGQLHRLRATLYHSPYYLMPYWPGLPTVLTCYDLIPLAYPRYFSPMQRLIYWLAHRLALSVACVLLAISEATKADLIRHFRIAPDRILVTPLAADARFAPCPLEDIAAVRQKYALPDGYVLYVGSNKPHKNLVRLIEAWSLVVSSAPYAAHPPLVIAGHWDSRYPQTQEKVVQSGIRDRVIFLHDVPEQELAALYSGASLFVFPSLYEGFGLPVLEAMACGTPVVCSHTSSLPEVAGDAALLVDPLDVEGIAASIRRALGDEGLRQRMREKGLARAAIFSWEQTARMTLAAYERALMGRFRA